MLCMTTCNVKGVTCSDKPLEDHQKFPSAVQCVFGTFQLIILVLQPLLFWFTLTTLINLVSSCRQMFSAPSNKQQTDKVSN